MKRSSEESRAASVAGCASCAGEQRWARELWFKVRTVEVEGVVVVVVVPVVWSR